MLSTIATMPPTSSFVQETLSPNSPITPPNSHKRMPNVESHCQSPPRSVLSLDPLPFDEIEDVARQLAPSLFRTDGHSYLPCTDEVYRVANSVARLDFQQLQPPRCGCGSRPKQWTIETVLRVFILIHYDQHAQWYVDSNKEARANWITELNIPGPPLLLCEGWEGQTRKFLSSIIGDVNHRVRHMAKPLGGRVLLDRTIQNALFCLYFAIEQHEGDKHLDSEDICRELRVMGFSRCDSLPRMSLPALRREWRETKGSYGLKLAMDLALGSVESAVQEYAKVYAAESGDVLMNFS
jgi:hypothetical protein